MKRCLNLDDYQAPAGEVQNLWTLYMYTNAQGVIKKERERYLDTLAVELIDGRASQARRALRWAAVTYSTTFCENTG